MQHGRIVTKLDKHSRDLLFLLGGVVAKVDANWIRYAYGGCREAERHWFCQCRVGGNG